MPTADAARVRALVAGRDPKEPRRVFAVRADPMWAGPEVLDGTPPIRVVPVRSPLAAREAVLSHRDSHGDDESLLVLLTDCPPAELGLDLRAQLVRGEVQSFDPFNSVLALFKAQLLDPALAKERWLIDDLIALAPATGWRDRSPLSGVLTAELAWETWQEARLGVSAVPSTLGELLYLVDEPGVRRALPTLTDEAHAGVEARWAPSTPQACGVILSLLSTRPDVSPTVFGLVVELLWATTDDPSLAQRQVLGRVRLEKAIGRDRLGPADAAAWGAASEERIAALPNAAGLVADAEQLLDEIDGVELSVLSDLLPRGFDARLAAFGHALAAEDLSHAAHFLAELERHTLAPRRARRVAACRAAVRLLRRAQSARPPGAAEGSFADLAVQYRAELAWVEQARRELSAGEQSVPLAAAFGHLAEEATAAQVEAGLTFAAALQEWSKSTPTPDARIVPVEDLLESVVAVVGRDAPVLLVVCDGMGLSVSHLLMADLQAEQWLPAGPAGIDPWPIGVATLPTVTAASRTSLLSGRLTVGAQAEERAGFAGHPGLRRVSKTARPPVLFHKGGLVAANGAALPSEIRAAVADPDQRLVGVVVNSVDDHLARGDQINVGWDLASLGPLGWLLEAAAEAGRVVVVTADHGHVLDNGRSLARPQATEGGERWRTAATPPQGGEIAITGPRVLLGGGTVVVPVDERVRYGPPKHGYHGGATPEEVLVPVEVLARRLPSGWAHRPSPSPSWWNDAAPAMAPLLSAPVPESQVPIAKTGPQPSLFDPVSPPESRRRESTWVDALLSSPTFAAHREGVRLPRPLPDDRLRRYLDAIAANADTIAFTSLAAITGEPAGTLRMTLSVVQRLLNADGEPVLTVHDDSTVVCNVALMALQFDLDLPAGPTG